MNIYKKMTSARVELQKLQLKKTGENTYSHYKYYELGDFLPAINKLCEKHGLFTKFSIIKDKSIEKAVLSIYNTEEVEEKIEFVAPTAEVEIGKKKDGTGGAEPIQNLGGKITYMRRYMLMTAFEMVESDMIERIQRELTDDISDEDLKAIDKAKDSTELIKVCGELKKKYRLNLITPHYERRAEEIKQEDDSS
jgi:hypothetical protein